MHSSPSDTHRLPLQIIQQWQFAAPLGPDLLSDRAFENCRRAGITSLQSYVTWASIEPEKGRFTFRMYDVVVEKLRRHGLKWVPFLILGPYYATPDWFLASPHSHCAVCLEHGETSRIQSIWNPHLPEYVERFLDAVATRYSDTSIFESITLGISGNWGEAIYPASGCFRGGFHVHPGWWCGDAFALRDFQSRMENTYGTIDRLNRAWSTRFGHFSDVRFPPVKGVRSNPLVSRLVQRIPERLKPAVRRMSLQASEVVAWLAEKKTSSGAGAGEQKQRQWIDFVRWYHDAMTRWAAYWLASARRRFPDTAIYLVAGGKGEPVLGADLSAQAKAASRANAGIRITNQNDSYADSCMWTRLVSSACRFYGAPLTTEEAGLNSPKGVAMRLFDAVSTGAAGAYFKCIISTGTDLCAQSRVPAGSPTRSATRLGKNSRFLYCSEPVIQTAVFYPNTAIYDRPGTLDRIFQAGAALRKSVDFDFADELLVANGCLRRYRFLIILDPSHLREDTMEPVMSWVSSGGVLLTVAGTPAANLWTAVTLPAQADGRRPPGGWRRLDQGYILPVQGRAATSHRPLARAIYNRRGRYPWPGCPSLPSGVYASRLPDRILCYDETCGELTVAGER